MLAREQQLQAQAAASSEQLHAWTKTLAEAHQSLVGRLREEHAELSATHSAATAAHAEDQAAAAKKHAGVIGELEARLQTEQADALRLARRSNAEWEAQLVAVEAERSSLLAELTGALAGKEAHEAVLAEQAASHQLELAAVEARAAAAAAAAHEQSVLLLRRVELEGAAQLAALEAELAALRADRGALLQRGSGAEGGDAAVAAAAAAAEPVPGQLEGPKEAEEEAGVPDESVPAPGIESPPPTPPPSPKPVPEPEPVPRPEPESESGVRDPLPPAPTVLAKLAASTDPFE